MSILETLKEAPLTRPARGNLESDVVLRHGGNELSANVIPNEDDLQIEAISYPRDCYLGQGSHQTDLESTVT